METTAQKPNVAFMLNFAARGKVFKCWPRKGFQMLSAERFSNAAHVMKFSSFERQAYQFNLGKTELHKKYRASSRFWAETDTSNCFEASLCIETTWITICYWPAKFSRCLKLARLQKRLHIPDLIEFAIQ